MRSTTVVPVLLSLSAVLLLAGSAAAATIHVPGDHATIQEAVGDSTEGDTILVGPGTYVENVLVYQRSGLTIRGKKAILAGPAVQNLDASPGPASEGPPARLTIAYCTDVSVSGFTFREFPAGAVLVTQSQSVDISKCVVEGGTGDAIRLIRNDVVRITRCVLSAPGGSGVTDDGTSDLLVEKCTVTDPSGDGIRLSAFSAPGNFSDRAEVVGNTVSGAVFGIVVRGTASVVERNSLVDCRHFGIQWMAGDPGQGGIIAKNRIHASDEFAQGIWSEGDGAVVSRNVLDGVMTNGIQATGTGATVDGNRVSGSVNGIMVGGSGIIVSRNTVKGAAQYSFALYGDDLAVEANVAQGSAGDGFDAFCSGSTFTGNRATGIARVGFYVEGTGNAFARNAAKGSGIHDLADRNASGVNDYTAGNKFGTSEFEYLPIE